GVFGHVLFPQMFSVGRVIADPGVTALPSPGLVKLYDVFILLLLPQSVVSKLKLAEEKHEDSLKKKPAFSTCDVSQRSFPCPVGANVLGVTMNRSPRGLDETPQCVSTRRLISRPRKA